MWLRLHFYAGVPDIAKATKGVISLFISSSAELKEMKDEFLFGGWAADDHYLLSGGQPSSSSATRMSISTVRTRR
jgi:hypothetical protein